MTNHSKLELPLSNKMKRNSKKLWLATALAVASLAGCNKGGPEIVRVQTNLVDKSIFEGEWWVMSTAVDVDGDATAVGGTHSGDDGYDWAGVLIDGVEMDWAPVIGRIRWVIDEDFLYAYRSWEVIDGGNNDGREPEFRGQPLAAFAIEDHIDIRRGYNPLTGEATNVVEENTADGQWFERQYMRVDWGMNHSQSFTFLSDLADGLSGWERESSSFFVQDEQSHEDFPRSYAPQFVRVGEDPEYKWAHEWPEDMQDTVHYMSFTTKTMLSPGASCVFVGGGPCQTVEYAVKNSFLRIPPNHEYNAEIQSHQEFDRFGLFRTYQRTYVRGGRPGETETRRCDTDGDCAGGFCDVATHVCAGGLSEDYGETDFLAMYRPRHNFFRQSFRRDASGERIACTADWQCNGRYGDEDIAAYPGSTCDRSARACTIPMQERELQQVAYHLNAGYPAYLVKAAFRSTASWTEVFMEGWRGARSQALPDYSAFEQPVQTDDPTQYCFEGSAEDQGGFCTGKWDPFVSPEEWEARGVANPYRCHITNADGWDEPARPSSYDEYTLPSAYRFQFVGEECGFVLKANSCDWNRTDADVHCDDVVNEEGSPVRWEQMGDPRYTFFNYVDQVYTRFGGISEIRMDPISGELISADANYSAAAGENIAFAALEFYPVLRCTNDEAGGCAPGEEGADERYFSGENRRLANAAAGLIERPVRVAPSGTDGITIEDYGRPNLPTHNIAGTFLERVESRMDRIEPMYGEEAGFLHFQERLQDLQGTAIEEEMLAGLSDEIMPFFNRGLGENDIQNVDPTLRANDPAMVGRASPFRQDGLEGQIREMRQNQVQMARLGADFPELTDVRTFLRRRYHEYWAEAFRGRPLGEASIRMQQWNLQSVQEHELGHSVGLRHNMGASMDRNNYKDGYFRLAVDEGLALPSLEDYDLPANGGDADGFVGAQEINNYQVALREMRDERDRRGLNLYTTASTMDYPGDLSRSFGLGRYDHAAVNYSYFNLSEAYVGDPRISASGTNNDLHASHVTDRVWWTTYSGGEGCNIDDDCPHGPGSATLVEGQAVYQRCIQNTRNTRLPTPCEGGGQCVCSAFTEDMKDLVDGFAYNNDVDNDRQSDFTAVKYLFCPDERLNDISWCSTFDSGESFVEVIDHYRRSWYEGYGRNYFRQFTGVSPGSSVGYIVDAAKIYQHVFFRLNFEAGFLSNEGPLGFRDQFAASAEAMNWFIEMANLPDQGSYQLDADRNRYVFMGEDEDPNADFYLPPGQGFGMWTKYEDGHQGFFRAARAGVYLDKLFALYALSQRDWNLNFSIDERYFINFYDLFPLEMTEFFGGMILDEPDWHAPRVAMNGADPTIIHPNFNQGLLFGECNVGGTLVPCTGEIADAYPEPTIDGTSNIWLRRYASIRALATFPVFYDTSFEQRLIVWKLGDGFGADIPDTQSDGSTACVYGEYAVNPDVHEVCNNPDDASYAVYYSDRLHTAYAAVKVTPRLDYNEEIEQLGFQFLRKLIDLQNQVRELETSGTDPDRLSSLRRELVDNESYLNQLIYYMKIFGISNTFGI